MKGKTNKSFLIYLVVGLIVALPWIVYVAFFYDQTLSSSTSDWGAFGDYIGGVSSVITAFVVIYISRHLQKTDTYREKMKNAISEIYDQLVKIDADNVDCKKTIKFLKLVEKNRLYLPINLYDSLVNLHDYYISLKGHLENRNTILEESIIGDLKKLYDE